jgi:hypothetical protein
MSDAEIASLELAPGTEALIESLLRQHGPQRRPRPVAPTPSVLVRYLCNVLPAAEAREVERSLTAASEARKAVREVRLLLDRLQSLSWSEVTAIAQGSSREAETAQAWMALVAQTLQIPSPEEAAPNSFGVDAFAASRHRASAGGAHALWTTLLAFGAQWQAQLRRPEQALVRGSAETLPIHGAWKGECSLLEARVDAAGTLYAVAALADPSDAPATEFSGRIAYLALPVGSEILLCAASTLDGERVSWTVAGIGDGIGQREAILPVRGLVVLIAPPEWRVLPVPSLMRLSQEVLTQGFLVAAAETPTESEEVVGLLTANVLPANDREEALPPALWEILEPSPRTENGRLVVAVRLSAITRSAYAGSHRLLLDIAVSPNEWQRLGAWPVEEWGESARTLSISCPGRADGALASLTLLRASLAPLDADSSDVPLDADSSDVPLDADSSDVPLDAGTPDVPLDAGTPDVP